MINIFQQHTSLLLLIADLDGHGSIKFATFGNYTIWYDGIHTLT